MWKMMAFCVLAASALMAQSYEETEYAYSCSLSIKITVFPPDTGDRFGRGYVEVFLCDKDGVPVPNQQVQLVTTCGVLSCQAPGWYDNVSSISTDKSCFTSGADGKIQVYLSQVPFNTPGRITATSVCNQINVKGSGTFKIDRTLVKKRTRSTKR